VERPGHAVGRETELAALRGFLQAEAAARALVLTGGPGIGKTTLWEAGIGDAREQRIRVLVARPSEAEARLSCAGLIDLLGEVDGDDLAALPSPQRHALEAALLRADPTESPPAQGAVAVGLLAVLRNLAARGPLLVAVDDVQWLDPASTDALVYAARRLDGEARFLLAKRPGQTLALERALERRGLDVLEVGPLSLGATRRMLSLRLGLTVSRHVLRRVHESTLGNPLFALEVGRSLAESGQPGLEGDIPVPETVEALLGTRVARLPPAERRLLLAVALSGDLRPGQLASIGDAAAVGAAVDAGVLVIDGDRVRPSHPLLAAAATRSSEPSDRRELHLELANVVADEGLQALHLAHATTLPDERLAAALTVAAAEVSSRGAAREAAVVSEHALRLTPPDSMERSERLLALAGYFEVAGERQRVTDLLSPELDTLSRHDRVRAWLRLAEGGAIRSIYDTEEYLDLALAASEDDPVLRAHVLTKKSIHASPACVWRIPEAEAWALEALPVARESGPVLERLALHGLGWARAMRGLPIDAVCDEFRAASRTASHITDSPEPVAGLRLLWRGHVQEARAILTEFLQLADERGEEVSYALQRMNLCDLELRAGNWNAAAQLLDEWDSADRQLLIRATYERSRALLAAGRGMSDEAERRAASALAGAEPGGYRWQVLEARRASGLAALLAHDPERAADDLRAVWEHTEREGVDEPGAFPVVHDLVEALIELGALDEARAVSGRLYELAEQQNHPWGRVTAGRCGALIRLAEPAYDEQAAADLSSAAAEYGVLGLRFDAARSLLSLGRVQRRHRKWGAARVSLEQAAVAFDELGSPGWVEAARSELERVGGRRAPATGELTPAERRVVELAVDGLSNKEIARSLVVAVPTVETHLSRAYAKLGIRSRAQLSRRLASG
jgi:DNA-binding CsgD family transcriptional regulator